MSLVTTATVTINAAFLQEIKDVDQELWRMLAELSRRSAELREVEQGPPYLELLMQFRDQLALHFALEEAYGYFDDPEFAPPRMCRAAANLRQEHRTLYVALTNLCERSEHLGASGHWATFVDWAGPRFLAFASDLHSHERRENELILEALDRDLGCGD